MKPATLHSLKWMALSLGMLLLSACSATKSQAVVELNSSDKMLNCTDLQLEMTEAEFLRDKAERNRGLNLHNVVTPLGYPVTYYSADGAIDAATNRIDYLTRLYAVKGCANQPQMPQQVAMTQSMAQPQVPSSEAY